MVRSIRPTTIDNLPDEWHEVYASLLRDVEETYAGFRIKNFEGVGEIHSHAYVESLEIAQPLLEILMGTADPKRKTLAMFTVPPGELRRSPFDPFLIGPTLGSHEKQAADYERLEGVPVEGRLEEARRQALSSMYEYLGTINRWLLEVKGFQAQYQQG